MISNTFESVVNVNCLNNPALLEPVIINSLGIIKDGKSHV